MALTCGDEDLIIHSGRTYRERYLEGRLFSVLFGPIASFGCRDFRARTCLLRRYIGDSEAGGKNPPWLGPYKIVKFFSGKTFGHQTSESSGITLGGGAPQQG
jgi:hypothetical protein